MNICSRHFIFGTPCRNIQTGQIKQKQLSKQLVADDFHPSSLSSAANPHSLTTLWMLQWPGSVNCRGDWKCEPWHRETCFIVWV